MNVLVFILSLMNDKASVIEYKAPNGETYKGKQTNEAAAKYLIEDLHNRGDNLGKIIAITSYQAKQSGKDQFIKGVGEFCKGKNIALPEIVLLPNYIKDKEINEIEIITDYYDYKPSRPKEIPGEKVLESVLKEISPNDKVYLDVTGGRRTDVNMMLLLMKLIKYKKIDVKDAFYSDFDGTIKSHNDFYGNLDILDGVNQFVTTGNASQLEKCFSSRDKDSHEDSHINKLLKAMVEFSDDINLCDLSKIDETLKTMKSEIDEIDESNEGGMDMFLFREIIPLIKDKFFGDSGNPDYCQIILWCLDNSLVQQAITLYVEKIPKYFVEKGILFYSEEYQHKIRRELKELNIESALFFHGLMLRQELLDEKAEKDPNDELLEELDKWLQAKNDKESYDPVNASVITATETIETFRSCSKKKSDKCIDVANSILNDPGKYNDDVNAFVNWFIDVKSSKSNGESGIDKIYNVVKAKKQIKKMLLHIPPPKSDLQKRMDTIDDALEMTIPKGIEVYISKRDLQTIMLHYLYAKKIRNRINHAADLEKKQKDTTIEFLKRYDIDYSFSMGEIKSQLDKSVNYILDLKPQKPKD